MHGRRSVRVKATSRSAARPNMHSAQSTVCLSASLSHVASCSIGANRASAKLRLQSSHCHRGVMSSGFVHSLSLLHRRVRALSAYRCRNA